MSAQVCDLNLKISEVSSCSSELAKEPKGKKQCTIERHVMEQTCL